MTDQERLGPYRLLREVGYGGMGSVFLAVRMGPGGFAKRLAIKTIHPHLARQKSFVHMFLDEARVAALMNHPNIAHVFDLGEVGGTHFLVMEYLQGEHLGAVRAKLGHVDERMVASIAALAARGLHHAHEARDDEGESLGLVHRDVSPQNIFLTYDGQVKVTDFGIARAEGRLAQTTQTGRLKGKCAYMAPEQITSKSIDRRTDVFALGIVMWELLQGKPLFAANNDADTVMNIIEARVPALDACEPELARIVMKALRPAPNERYQSAEELADALDAYLAERDEGAGRSATNAKQKMLAEWMGTHFTDERREKQRRDKESDSSSGSVPTEETRVDSAAAAMQAMQAMRANDDAEAKTLHDATDPQRAPQKPASRSAGTKRRWPTLAIWALAAIAALLVAATLFWQTQDAADAGAEIRIDSRPSGAAVRIDGRELEGTTPIVVQSIAHGHHRLSLHMEGFETREITVDVDSERMELEYLLRPIQELGADGAEATNGDTTNGDLTNDDTTNGDLAVNAEDERQGTGEQQDSVPPTAPQAANDESQGSRPARGRRPSAVSMQPQPTATLTLMTFPTATIRINGRDYGETPLNEREVPSGVLHLELRAGGTGPLVRRTLRAEPNETLNRGWRLPE